MRVPCYNLAVTGAVPERAGPRPAGGETYAFTGSADYAGFMAATRSASTQAAFLRPHLRPGMTLLDCGCGPGSITVGLAELVAPGAVTGVDTDAAQVERASAGGNAGADRPGGRGPGRGGRAGAAAFAAAWATGAATPFELAVAEAEATAALLAGPASGRAAAPAAPRRGERRAAAAPLSPREHEVARLIAQGHSNRGIAAALVLSERTV